MWKRLAAVDWFEGRFFRRSATAGASRSARGRGYERFLGARWAEIGERGLVASRPVAVLGETESRRRSRANSSSVASSGSLSRSARPRGGGVRFAVRIALLWPSTPSRKLGVVQTLGVALCRQVSYGHRSVLTAAPPTKPVGGW